MLKDVEKWKDLRDARKSLWHLERATERDPEICISLPTLPVTIHSFWWLTNRPLCKYRGIPSSRWSSWRLSTWNQQTSKGKANIYSVFNSCHTLSMNRDFGKSIKYVPSTRFRETGRLSNLSKATQQAISRTNLNPDTFSFKGHVLNHYRKKPNR